MEIIGIPREIKPMSVPFHVTTQLHEAEFRGGLTMHAPHCIAYNLPKDKVQSVLENISKKPPPDHEASVYTASVDWIESLTNSISQELSKNFNAQPVDFVKTGRDVANIVSSVGNGIWSSGITPINAIQDIETNFPLYISDYFDQLSGWSREHVFDQNDTKIGSNLTGIQKSNQPYPASSPYGLESPLSQVFVKISWSLPVAKVNRPFNTGSNTPTFSSSGVPSDGEVYRYYAFIDQYKQAVSLDENGSVVRKTYNFTDSSQIWRIENYGNYYALYNKKYKQYLGRNLTINNKKPDNSWHGSAVYIVEDQDTSVYSIGYTENNRVYHTILDNLTLVTIPLVAWRNPSGHFLNLDEKHGTLNFSQGEKHGNTVIPASEQLFLFVPHPDFSRKAVVVGHNGKLLEINPLSNKASCGYDLKSSIKLPFSLFDYKQNVWPRGAHYLASRLQQSLILGAVAAAAPPPGQGTRVRVWKADPYVKSIGIRELFLVHTDITTGPKDDLLETSSSTNPIAPDKNGDFLLDFDDTPTTVPESDNHTQFDVIHTYSCVRYTYDLLTGDLEYLDGSPPDITRPWGDKRLVIHPHAGEQANAFYSRQEGVLKFFYTTQNGKTIYLCRSFDVVAHEAGHSFLDILQPGWLSDGQTGGFHEAFGDLCSLFVLLSMAEIADLFVTLTKANLRDPTNFISAVGEEFGDALYNNKGKGLRNLSNTITGSQAGTEVHALSQVFSGFYYDVLVDVFALERNPSIKSDTETLMDVATYLRRALIIAIRVSSARATRTKYQELATNLETAFGTLGRRLGVDLSNWSQIVRKYAKSRELSIAGLS